MRKPLVSALALGLCACVVRVNTHGSDGYRSNPMEQASKMETSRATAAGAKVFPYDVVRETLPNGLKVIMIPMPANGLAAYWSIVRTGSRDEVEPGVTGFAHFFEHMMFRGTEKLPGAEYDRIVNGIGADANAFTSDDLTAYHLGFAREDLPTVVRIEADRFQNLKYDETAFKTESGAVYGEYRKGRTNPFEVLFEALQNTAFDRHTYKHTTIGFEADIQAMPEHYEYSLGFFRRFYRPENVVILVAGDIDPKATLEMIRKEYGGWQKGYQAPEVPVEPPQTAPRRVDVAFDGQTLPVLAVTWKGERLTPGDGGMLAGLLLGDLVFGETSPLYKKLVLDEQRAESLFASFDMTRDPGLWGVLAMVKDPADVAAIEVEVWRAVEELQRDGVAQERLDAVRSNAKYDFLTGLTTPTHVCESLARLIAITGDVAAVDQMYVTLDQVTPADVQKAAQRFLRPETSTVAVLHARDEPLPAPPAGAAEPVLLPVAQDPNVSFKLWFKAGSQSDPPGKEGLAELTGAMISEGGTRTRSYDQILEKLFPLAAGYGVSVDKEQTVVSGVVHRDKVGAFYGLLVDAVVNPGFREDDFERLRDQAISSIENELRYSSDEELGKAALVWRVFRGTPYAHIEGGTVESLRAITLDDVRSFWAGHFTRDNLVIALGGAFPEDLPRRLAADLGRLPEGVPAAPPAPAPAPIQGRQVLLVQKPGPSTAISFGYPVDLQRGSREFYALWIANSWLGEHRNSSSHLYQVIRAARGLNYGDYSYIEAYPNGGRRDKPPTGVGRRRQMFEVWIRPLPEEQALFALRAALREVDLLRQNGLTAEQFEFTRNFLRKYILHFAPTTAERLGYAVDDRFYGLDEPHLQRFRRMLDAITLDEVNAAIRKHLQTENLVIAMVTEHADEMKQKLAGGAPSPITYPAPKPQEILDEDQAIASWPLNIIAANITIVPVDQMFEKSEKSEARLP
ncbi:MAG: insulinase family protein [Planctomycetota bacterium]|nr:MAG: insulinase family protein [Planctomycetota bacterium]